MVNMVKEYEENPYENIYETLAATAKRTPYKVGVIDAHREITYEALQKEADVFAHYLKTKLKVKKGDSIAIMMVNSIQFLVAFYGTIKIGGVVVCVNTKLQGTEIEHILSNADAKAIVLDGQWMEKVEGVVKSTQIEHIILGRKSESYGENLPSMEEILLDAHGKEEDFTAEPIRDKQMPAVIIHTSGTTGKAKGAIITHQNILQNAYGYEEVLGLTKEDITVLSVPIFHILGLSCVSTLFVYLGGLLVLEPFFKPEETLKNLTKYKATHFHSAPTVFILLSHAKTKEHNLSSLKSAVCGGAFISDTDKERFCSIAPNAFFRVAYGMTETAGAGVLSATHLGQGRAMPNVAIKIADEKGETIKTGETGQIFFKGPVVIEGYCKSRDKASFLNGWFASGDIGRMDEKGDIYILDRIKDLINRGGEKIFPYEVENAIMKFKGVKQVVVFPLPDLLYGEIPGAVVVPQEGKEISISELKAYLYLHLAKYEVPTMIEVRKNIPYTASGKVQKYILAEEFSKKVSSGSLHKYKGDEL